MKARWPAARNVAVVGQGPGGRDDGRASSPISAGIGTASASRPTSLARRPRGGHAGRTPPSQQRLAHRPRAAAIRRRFAPAKAQPITLEGSGKIGRHWHAWREPPAMPRHSVPPQNSTASTLALAAGLVQEMRLGRGAAPGRLSVSLSATDYVGHSYGTGGQEMCLQLLELDRELGDFFALLDGRGIDYAVALTADHGGIDIPERAAPARRDRCGSRRPALAASAIGPKLLGDSSASPGPVLFGDSQRRRLDRPAA